MSLVARSSREWASALFPRFFTVVMFFESALLVASAFAADAVDLKSRLYDLKEPLVQVQFRVEALRRGLDPNTRSTASSSNRMMRACFDLGHVSQGADQVQERYWRKGLSISDFENTLAEWVNEVKTIQPFCHEDLRVFVGPGAQSIETGDINELAKRVPKLQALTLKLLDRLKEEGVL